MPETARCAWEITAGIIPGQPLPEYTRRWVLTSSEWYGADGEPSHAGVALFCAQQAAAMEYARSLANPGALNWARVEWIWF